MRSKQCLSDINNRFYSDPKVTIFAPNWVRKGLKQLRRYVKPGTVVKVKDDILSTRYITLRRLGLKQLQIVARNERMNTSGIINFSHYEKLIRDKSVIYAIKDLLRQCIIVGSDKTTHFGGYNSARKKQVAPVVVIDLSALEFRQPHNTGRLVLVGHKVPKGLLDDLIYQNVVGEKRPTFAQARNDRTGRFVKKGAVYFDTYAYERFVEKDFSLVCLALHKQPGLKVANVNLKFLKYGCGGFAGNFRDILEKHINEGIRRALKKQFKLKSNRIKSFEFPFFRYDKELFELCDRHRAYCGFTRTDALKRTDYPTITVTTNCANPHAMPGNTMNFSSVDGAIAMNLRTKANKFSAIINTKMKEKFIKIHK